MNGESVVSTLVYTYAIIDTGQETCYNTSVEVTCPTEGEAFYGQDA